MLKKLYLILVVALIFLISVTLANADPLADFGYNARSYPSYDARYHHDDSVSKKTGGWRLVIGVDDQPGVFEQIDKVKLINLTTGLTIIADPETLERYIWLGNANLELNVWLGHEWNVEGEWKAVLLRTDGIKFIEKFSLANIELNVPKPPIVDILHMHPVDGGTLLTFKAPAPQNWSGGIQVRIIIFGDADADGKPDDAVDVFRNGCPGDPSYDPALNFCFDPVNDTTTFFVPYSGVTARIGYHYFGTDIGTSRTVKYFNLP